MKTKCNDVNYSLERGIDDKDIDAVLPANIEDESAEVLEESSKSKKTKRKAEVHEAIVPDPRVQTGEAILIVAAVSSQVGRVSIPKVLAELRITDDELASPLALVHHNGMVSILPNTRHPVSSADYDIQLTQKGKSLALFLISAEQERIASVAKKAEEAAKKPKKPNKAVHKSSKPPKVLSNKHQEMSCHI